MWVREMKHAAMLQEWSGRIAECRSSGMAVKNWCKAQGIAIKTYYYWEWKFVTEASRQSRIISIAPISCTIRHRKCRRRCRLSKTNRDKMSMTAEIKCPRILVA